MTLSTNSAVNAQHKELNLLKLASSLSGIELVAAVAAGKLPPPPMAQTMPIELMGWTNGSIEIAAQPQAQFYNMHDSIHGGWIMTLLDTSMALAALTTLSPGETCPSTETSVKFVRPITLVSGLLTISGHVINKGKNLITLEGRIVDKAGKLYAHGTSTCMVIATRNAT